MKLFVEDLKGYMEAIDNVKRVVIEKIDNKNNLLVYTDCFTDQPYTTIPLKDIKLSFMVKVVKDKKGYESVEEYFRYEK